MTLKDLLKRVKPEEYDKVIIVSDGKGWTNIGSKVIKTESTIMLTIDREPLFDD